MRPKIVILTLVVAIGLVALAAVLKGVIGGHGNQEAKAPEPPPVETPAAPITPVKPPSGNNAALIEELRTKERAKQLDEVRELQADGTANPATISLLLAKLTNPEAEVRKAALEALVQLNDTNAIPGLEQAQGLAENPQEKVALTDAIAYLKLPNINDGVVAPTTNDNAASSAAAVAPSGGISNPPRQPGARKQGRRSGVQPAPAAVQPAAPANTDQTQPATPAPGTAPPQ